ncbi:MAG: hypothetical protein NTZ51_06615 [Proteobacteria bacterium]|nr:hypothetical protein [Pseudomonadota bacterium]
MKLLLMAVHLTTDNSFDGRVIYDLGFILLTSQQFRAHGVRLANNTP